MFKVASYNIKVMEYINHIPTRYIHYDIPNKFTMAL